VPDLLFVGFMRYGPNIDAVRFLHREIVPILRSACREPFTLSLVGMNPPAWMRDLGREPGIEVTGRVDSVEPYYRRAAIAVCPIRYGGGTRIKILEAMSFGRPVVATTVGAEGIDAEPGRDILIADTPRAFAEACLGLLRDPALRESIGASGRALVERSYAEPVVAAHLHALLDRRLNGVGGATEMSFERRA
jgi:glycosyltransferase involved in cell wall biosynthesis